jgi:tetratricopeptide (TPR) repeat protein
MRIFKLHHSFIVFILVGILISGCSIQKNTKSKDISLFRSDSIKLSSEQLFDFKYQFFEANKNFLNANYDLALGLFNNCLKIDSTSAVVHYKLASIFLFKKELQLAEHHAERSVYFNNSNVWYLYLAGNIYTQNGNIVKAKEAFNRLIQIDPGQLDFYLNLADVYIKDNDIKGAIGVYTNIESLFGISEIISLQKHKLYLASKNNKAALNELINLAEANPGTVEYQRMVGDFYLQINNIDDAIIIYNKILINFPNDGFSHVGLAECYRKKGDIEKSFIEIKIAFKSEEIPSDVKFNMLLSLIQNAGENAEIQKAAYDLTEILVKMYPEDADLNTIYANFLLQKGQLKEAQELLIKVVTIRKDKYAVWEQLILLDNQFQQWDLVFTHSSEALKYFPNQSFLYFFNGFSSFQLKDYEHAIKSLSFGYKLITKDDPLVMDYLTFLGESYYKLGNKDEAYQQFDDILKIDSENIMVLNNYAYYLSLDNEKLEKAEKMSKITITKQPNSSTYLDTYAWILFKMNRNAEALVYIEKAIANDTLVSDVVLEHYGDILYRNERVNDAVNQWIKAKLLGEGSGLLEKKILGRAYFEE